VIGAGVGQSITTTAFSAGTAKLSVAAEYGPAAAHLASGLQVPDPLDMVIVALALAPALVGGPAVQEPDAVITGVAISLPVSFDDAVTTNVSP
jgi:hypothetical protein